MSADQLATVSERRAALHKALSDPLRHRLLVLFDERVASPKEASEELGVPLDKIAYHVRYLAGNVAANRVPLIELVDTDVRRGGIQHFYKGIERPIIDIPEAEETPQAAREESTLAILPLMRADVDRALAAGTFDSHAARALLRLNMTTDDQGIREAGEASMRYLAELQGIEARSANRLAETSERPRRLATQTLTFPLPTAE